MVTGYKRGPKVMLRTAHVPDMVDELREMDERVFLVEKYVIGRYYILQGCVSKMGIPFTVAHDWCCLVREVGR